MLTIDETIAFIKDAHAGQTDKAGKPYWLHPVDVMHRLGPDATEHEKLAALLHDVLEDTPYVADDLRALGYSEEVVQAVILLTRPEGADRPGYFDWVRSIAASGNAIAIKVKMADNEANSDPARLALLPEEDQFSLTFRYERARRILSGEGEERLFFHATPDPDACKHDFQGWVEIDGGRGGTTVCTKCGMDAMSYTLRTGIRGVV